MAMNQKTFYFLGGLPRAGSTLLCNILAQNLKIHATHTSGCMDIMFGVRNNWGKLIEHQAHPDDEAQRRVLKAILESYYSNVDRPVIIDKCRGWLSLIEMIEWVLGHQVKILVPVRDLRDVLASFEKLWREQTKNSQINGEADNYFQFQTIEGRLSFWCRADQPVGLAVNRIKDALNRGFRNRIHFVPFEELTENPEQTLNKIYDFFNEPIFKHDFKKIQQVTEENDFVHGFKNLHKIRSKVESLPPQWPQILGDAAKIYANENFWDNV